MNYKLNRKLHTVLSVEAKIGYVSYVQEGFLHFNKYKFNIRPLLYIIDLNNNKIWIKNEEWDNFSIDIKKREITKLPFSLMLNGHFDDFFLINKNNNIYLYSIVERIEKFNLKNNNILFYYCSKRHIYLQQDLKLASFCLETEEMLWELNLFATDQIRTLIGAHQNQLIIFLNERGLMSINTDNGEILWQLPDFLLQFPKGEFAGLHWYWHLEDGYLYILKHRHYFRVNLSSQAVELLWENMDKTYSITHCTYTADTIFFTACLEPQIQPSILGVFNRKTLVIDWLYESDIFERDRFGSFNQAPQTDGEKLYFLDTTGTLHIFEKEKEA